MNFRPASGCTCGGGIRQESEVVGTTQVPGSVRKTPGQVRESRGGRSRTLRVRVPSAPP